ncbi:MAG: Plug domain-containing protein, partial [Halieaceae bacterium]|nr:Plug domain-containing protein [Halieaceae bacterium]
MFYQKKRLVCALALGNLLATPLTVAQSGMLEEVIVTAQKREQSLQDTPVAISAFDAAALEQQGISDVYDIGQFAPNVQIVETPSNSTAATISIRGSVTFNPAITWEPPVGLYLDGVFIGKN